MYCSHCGRQMESGARFCSNCGAAWQPSAAPRSQLMRPRHNRMIAGVCAAFALEYGWDVSLVRVLTALFIFFTGIPLLVYLALWIILPEAPYALADRSAGTPA